MYVLRVIWNIVCLECSLVAYVHSHEIRQQESSPSFSQPIFKLGWGERIPKRNEKGQENALCDLSMMILGLCCYSVIE